MTEQPKKSGGSKGCLIALGVVGVIMVVGIIGVTIFINKAKDVVEGVAEGMGVSPKMMARVENLNQDYPFEPSPTNRISEPQVKRYLAVKRSFADEVKKHEATLQQLDKRMQKKEQADWSDVTEGFKILGDIRRDFLNSLEQYEMSPKEYAYLTNVIYSTYFVEASRAGYEQRAENMRTLREQYKQQAEQLRQQLKNPDLTDEQRQSLETSLESYEKMMAQTKTTVEKMEQEYRKLPPENIELLDRYREQLKNLDTYGYELLGLSLWPAMVQ